MGAKQSNFKQRVCVFRLMLMGALAIVGARVAQLQLVEHEALSKLALGQYVTDITIPAHRGHIHDRNGQALAISVEVPSVSANPMDLNDPRDAARQLSQVLGINLDTAYRRLSSDRLFVWLKRQVSPALADRVRALGIPGVSITTETRRYYPNKELASHLIGFVGVDGNGLEGIERAWDPLLAGEPQIVPTLRDARGNSVLRGDLDPDHRAVGADVTMTIDMRIQHLAEEALRRTVHQTSAAGGVAVVLDVATAEVLAAAVEPTFNPNQASKEPPAHRRNRALTDMFEPGSAMKPLVFAAALDAEAVHPSQEIDCESGSYTIGRHTIRDARPHEVLSLLKIIQVSSNIGAAKVGQALGKKKLAYYLHRFGFGQRTGVKFPGETPGLLRDPVSWSDVGLATIAFGQGVAVGAIQLAAAYRVLAAKGMYRQPRLVKSIVHTQRRMAPLQAAKTWRVVSAQSAQRVAQMMEAVVGPNGTGYRAAVSGYRVAGKTGTAQKADGVAGGYSADRFMAVFGGFLPADDPRVVIVVVIDEPKGVHSGGVIAAPVFAKIAAGSMRQLNVLPSGAVVHAAIVRVRAGARASAAQESTQPVKPIAQHEKTLGGVPVFSGMTARQVTQQFVTKGLRANLEMHGSGRVIEQEPSPGTPIKDVTTIRVRLAVR